MRRRVTIGGLVLGPRPLVVAAGGEAEVEALATAGDADLLELRADLFADPQPADVVAALDRLRASGRPVILTVRAATEGGRSLAEDRRQALYTTGLAHADAIDVEIASTALVADLVPRARGAGRAVILSAHTVGGTPAADALLALVDRGEALGADVVKLVTLARDLDDVRTLLGVLLACRARNLVAFAMGPVGTLSRVFFPAAGSLLTYGHCGQPTAPGQLSVAELAALVRRFYPA
jgi:3-dehydroquinate dehydratase-1